ncbi:MAG: cytochrome c oxidase subunit 3 [Thiobacillus sp.]
MSVTTLPAISSRPPGDLAIWFVIFAELLTFGIFFLSYGFARAHHVALFDASQQLLDRRTGAINMVLLITSSYFVVRAVAAVKADDSRAAARWLLAAMGLGAGFILLKLGEFAHSYAAGITLSTNTFYMFYLSLTVFHFMHVVIGLLVLGVVARKAWVGGYSAAEHTGVETGAVYWHMVDMVWIVLFPLVYVIH